MGYFARTFKEIYTLDDVTEITEEQIVMFFSKMRKGEICRQEGKPYRLYPHFVKTKGLRY